MTDPMAGPEPTPGPKTRTEEFKISGDRLQAKIKELLHEGRVRNISLRDAQGRTLIEVPLAVGVAAGAASVILLPVWAAIGAIAALAADLTLVVEKEE
jgi:hypothetical protein